MSKHNKHGNRKTRRKQMLELTKLVEKKGVFIRDGMGALVADLRPWFDIIVEPGAQLTAHPAPFEGLTPDDIEAIFADRHV